MAIEIPEETAFYVRGAIERGITSVELQIQKMNKMLNNPKLAEFAEEFGMSGTLAYQEQWLREAKNALVQLPKEIRPHNL